MLVRVVWLVPWTINQPAAEGDGGSRLLHQFTNEADRVDFIAFRMVEKNHLVDAADFKFRLGAHTVRLVPRIRWPVAERT